MLVPTGLSLPAELFLLGRCGAVRCRQGPTGSSVTWAGGVKGSPLLVAALVSVFRVGGVWMKRCSSPGGTRDSRVKAKRGGREGQVRACVIPALCTARGWA